MDEGGFQVQWYPGHMTRTRRQMEQDIKLVDLVVELLDSRIPLASRNPDIDAIARNKPRLVLLNRADQADPAQTGRWAAWLRERGHAVLETDCKTGKGVSRFPAAARESMADAIARWKQKGQAGRPVRAMVVGIPNVGKSTFINQVARRKSARAGDRPGVTRGKQWVTVDQSLQLLDTPGILWPKFEDPRTGLYLAFTGAIRGEVMDRESLACQLMELLAERYPEALTGRYGIELPPDARGWQLLEAAGRRRGFLISGGEVDLERTARLLLDEFRTGKLGRFTLQTVEDII
ncbi:MAG: ribosome biogenesis GTPase YlqF [Oscillospiraceae bacterium]|nr:ribosome biogenesis GTPase YlqF [Oscillospiraceae bacterium]